MNNVKCSLNQFSNLVADELHSKDLDQSKRTSNIIETIQNSKTTVLNQRATEFLEKFDKRNHNQLLELSKIEL